MHLCVSFLSFSGVAGIDHENTGYVKFVDSIEKLADFQENDSHDFRKNRVKTCLGICCFFGHVSGLIFDIFGFILRVIWGFKIWQKLGYGSWGVPCGSRGFKGEPRPERTCPLYG